MHFMLFKTMAECSLSLFFLKAPSLLIITILSNSFLLAAPSDTQCREEYQTALQNYVVGRYVPRCRPDGGYEPLQCRTSYCFCVDKYGKEVPESRKSASDPPNCAKFGT